MRYDLVGARGDRCVLPHSSAISSSNPKPFRTHLTDYDFNGPSVAACEGNYGGSSAAELRNAQQEGGIIWACPQAPPRKCGVVDFTAAMGLKLAENWIFIEQCLHFLKLARGLDVLGTPRHPSANVAGAARPCVGAIP